MPFRSSRRRDRSSTPAPEPASVERSEGPDSTELTAALRVRDLHVRLHRGQQVNHALKGVDLTIAPGEIVALVGESGSGKSTLALATQALLPAESSPQVDGSIQVDGTEIVGAGSATLRRLRRERLGVVFQDPMTSLNPTMTIGRQMGEVVDDDAATVGWLDRVGIPAARSKLRAYPHELSGGQRQRVMIAMAMCRKPVLVLADEPTTALDVTVQARILELVRDLRDQTGTAFLFVTHDLSVAASIADRISVLYAGRLAEIGVVGPVMTAPAHPYTAALLRARFRIDADKGHQLPTLPAQTSAPDESGCLFAPRCLLVEDDCRATPPPLAPVSQHVGRAACFHSDQVRPDLWERVAQTWPAERRAADEVGPVVRVIGLSKTYRRRGKQGAELFALSGVDLTVAEGESVALVGESGSGKSTMLRIVAGLIEPTSGTVEIAPDARPQMVYQDASASLTPWLNVGELVGERLRPARLSRAERREQVGRALERVGLTADTQDRRPHQLSGGQRQRVAVARAIVVPPRLLLCDEPVSAMDVSLAASILNLLESLRRELGMAMLFVTHDLAAARFVADRIVVMQDGRVIEAGDATEVVSTPTQEYTRELLASMPEPAAAAAR